ncbi:MAG: hypothetical protein AAGE90_16755 [Pseudomonadota bacterium]
MNMTPGSEQFLRAEQESRTDTSNDWIAAGHRAAEEHNRRRTWLPTQYGEIDREIASSLKANFKTLPGQTLIGTNLIAIWGFLTVVSILVFA